MAGIGGKHQSGTSVICLFKFIFDDETAVRQIGQCSYIRLREIFAALSGMSDPQIENSGLSIYHTSKPN
jgi:hypothetical protein